MIGCSNRKVTDIPRKVKSFNPQNYTGITLCCSLHHTKVMSFLSQFLLLSHIQYEGMQEKKRERLEEPHDFLITRHGIYNCVVTTCQTYNLLALLGRPILKFITRQNVTKTCLQKLSLVALSWLATGPSCFKAGQGSRGAGQVHRFILGEFIKHLTRRVSLEPTLVQQIKLDLVESLLIL